MANAGQFRSDLYFRLRVVEIEIPPLRARGGDDIADLAEHFVDQFSRRYRKGPLRLADSGRAGADRVRVAGQRARAREHDRARGRARARARRSASRTSRSSRGARPRDDRGSDSQIGMPASRHERARSAADAITLPAGLSLEEAERRYARAVLDREAATSPPRRARSASAATSSRGYCADSP